MSDDQHTSPIKTPKQLITVIVLAFVVPIIVIILLVTYVVGSPTAGAGSDAILLLDAVDFGGSPGEITILRAEELPARVGTTHNPSLGLLMRYLEAESGAQVLLLGIQPASIGFGKPISVPVLASVEALARMLEARLGVTPEANDMEPAAGPRHAGSREGGQHR